MHWQQGDVVLIGGATYTAASGGSTTTTLTGIGAEKESGLYKAYYPASLCQTNGSSMSLNLPATQTYTAPVGGKLVADQFPMYAQSSGTNLTFHNLCAVLTFNLTGTDKVTKVVMTSDSKKLNGLFDVVADGTGFKAQMKSGTPTDAEKQVTLDCGTGVQLDASTGTEFCIAVPALDYPQNDLTVEVYGYKGSGTTEERLMPDFKNTAATGSQLERSKIYNITKEVSSLRYILAHTGTTVTLTDGTVVQEVVRSLSSAGPTGTAAFNSYRTPDGGTTKEAVDVAYEYAKADADGLPVRLSGEIAWSSTKPSTLSSVTSSGSDAKTFSATVYAYSSPVVKETVIDLLQHAENLKSRSEVGSSGTPRDLSMYDIHGTSRGNRPVTANCYIVDRAGWYMFPLVYGNAIDYTKSGVALYNNGVNAYAYKNANSPTVGTTYWYNFQNFTGTSISTPYVLDDAGGLASSDVEAVVVWQDVESASYSFIENVSVTDISSSNIFYDPVASSYKTSVPYIKFQVPQGSIDADESKDPLQRVTGIRQGNAVIAVRLKASRTIAGTSYAAGTILWSWHIWVTDGYDTDGDTKGDGLASIPVTNYAGVTLNMMPVNLGWCDASTTTSYKDRVWYVRVRQTAGSADPIIFRVVQNAAPATSLSSCGTYYQWGRKDPFIPAAKSGNKAAYSPAGYSLTTSGSDVSFSDSPAGNASTAIQNPYIFYYSSVTSGHWMSLSPSYDDPANLWNMALFSDYNYHQDQTIKVSKTVYDPCPPGYSLPRRYAFTGFTTTGNQANYNNFSQFKVEDRNGDGSISEKDYENGWYFYTNSSKTETIFFPGSSSRFCRSGGTSSLGYSGFYWTAGGNGENLGINNYVIDPRGGADESYGYSIRPVEEERP